MALTDPAAAPIQPARPFTARHVSARHFARLKLRVMANSFRGQPWRIGLFLVGVFFALFFAASGFLVGAFAGIAGNLDVAMLVAGLGGGIIALAWTLLPLLFFGVDETIDPSRFALLPLRRRTLVTGLFTAAMIGTPAAATLIATSGLIAGALALGGPGAAAATAVGIVAGLFYCVAASRALTSAFATMLRSRRMRDLAAVLLAVAAALIGPLQIAVSRASTSADWRRFLPAAEIVGWTPFGAPYTLGSEVAAGRAWAAALKLVIVVAAILLLLWWWSRTLESAMVGAATGGTSRRAAAVSGAPVALLFPASLRWAPRTRFGAVLAREVRYWWRDARRRANLITIAVVGLFVSVIVNAGGSLYGGQTAGVSTTPVTFALSMIFVGSLAAVTLANQFGFDGTAYAADVTAGVPGRVELGARAAGFAVYIVPMMVVIAIGIGFVVGEPGWIPLAAGTLLATFGGGLAVNLLVSVVGAYSLPETSNPFAMNTGAGVARGLLAFVAMIATVIAGGPMLLGAYLLGDSWLVAALPVGLLYGLGLTYLGSVVGGDILERRMPELLLAVTPRR